MARNVHGESPPYLPTRRWVDGSIADDLPAKRLSRLYSANHYIVSMVNPIATPFLNGGKERSQLGKALGSLGVGMGREMLNFYRGVAQKQGDNWPRFNMLLNGVHALMDQEYSGDINIVPRFRWYNPTKILAHLTEKQLMELMEAGERSTFPHVESIRTCTRISRTMEEILHRFEYGDLRPQGDQYHRPRASRRRPAPTRSDREAMRETGSQRIAKAAASAPKASKARKKVASKTTAGRGTTKSARPRRKISSAA
jgi:NTE family protein